MIVQLKNIIHTGNAISPRTGIIAFNYIYEFIKRNESVIIDFDGISNFTSSFCNSFIGKLYMIDAIRTKECLTIINTIDIWDNKIKDAKRLGENEDARLIRQKALDDLMS